MAQVCLVAVLAGLLGVVFVHQKDRQTRIHDHCLQVEEEIELIKVEITVAEQRIAKALSENNLYVKLARADSDLEKINFSRIRNIPLRRIGDEDQGVAMGTPIQIKGGAR